MSREPLKGLDPSLPELAFAPELSDSMCQDSYGIFFTLTKLGWVWPFPTQRTLLMQQLYERRFSLMTETGGDVAGQASRAGGRAAFRV